MIPKNLYDAPSYPIAKTAAFMKMGKETIRQMIASGELTTIVPPYQSRPRVLTSSIESAFRRIYCLDSEAKIAS